MKKTLLAFLPLFVILFLNISCSNSDDEDSPLVQDAVSQIKDEVINAKLRINEEVFNTINTNRKNKISKDDFYKINDAKRVGDFILINLSYNGGCSQHSFEIIWDGIVYTDKPRHMNLLLIHNANNDTCKTLITKTIVVNLEELIGDVLYKDNGDYHIFSTFNSTEIADVIVKSIN